MDKRTIDRARIPGTQLQYKKLGNTGLFSPMSKPVDVRNFSKSGLSFYGEGNVHHGDPILMKVIFPDGKHLRLKGEVRWARQDDAPDRYSIGVQFFPFGYGGKYNRPEALSILREKTGQNIIEAPANGNNGKDTNESEE